MKGGKDMWMERSAKALFVESDAFRVFLDSGLLEDVTSERIQYDPTKSRSEETTQR